MVQHNYKKDTYKLYNSDLCRSKHNTEAIQKQFPIDFPFLVHFWKQKKCSLKCLARSGSDSKKACPIYSSGLCGSAHDTEDILLVCCCRLFGFNLPKAISKWFSIHCSFSEEKKYSLKCLARSGSDPQKASPIYSSKLCGSAHDTEGILLVCCHHPKQSLNIDFY